MVTGANRSGVLRAVAGLALGWATSWVVLNGSFVLLRAGWPEYALADPEKAYTLTMLFVRLFIFSSMIAATSGVATLVAGDERFAQSALVSTAAIYSSVFSQTETCDVLSSVNGSRVQLAQRPRKLMPARRAIRSSSEGHT